MLKERSKEMLAYVFWHWRQDSITSERYEHLLRGFHESLAGSPPRGFHKSGTFRIRGAPWVPAEALDAYEDWYLLTGAAALDPLNDASISEAHRVSHDRIAQWAAGGCAGLYRLRVGDSALAFSEFALWFAKPKGMTYAALYELVTSLVERSGATLWARQMVLGPTPEFCLVTAGISELPSPLVGHRVERKRIWPRTD